MRHANPMQLMAYCLFQNTTQRLGVQLIYEIPGDLLKYLQVNLPRGVNSVQTLPYQLYVILYLLTVAGYNINNIVPGLDIPYTGLAPTPPFDIPVFRPNQTSTVLSCEYLVRGFRHIRLEALNIGAYTLLHLLFWRHF